MRKSAAFLAIAVSLAALAQTVQAPSPRQGRRDEVLPWSRFRPRGDPYKPTAEEKQQIQAKMDRLAGMIRDLRAKRADDALLADVEIFHQAANWIMTFPDEFFRPQSVASTLQVLDQGMERAGQLLEGKSPWTSQTGRLLRGYRSAIDGSVQPFRLTVPGEYDGTHPFPLDVTQHGRAASTYEVDFINAFARRGAEIPYLPGTFQIEVFGRGKNAYHWPGETDTFEAIEAVKKAYKIDPDRVALRGFSMGGAGVWHMALHYPDWWASVEAGAGDNESHRYPVLADLAPHQQAMCRIFDNMFEWTQNAYNTPFVAYVGELDGSFRKHILARQQLAREGFHFEGKSFSSGLRVVEIPTMVFFVGPNTGHSTHPEFRKRMDAIHYENLKRGRQNPDRIRFVTYTTRYNRSHWITVDGLEAHYSRAEVDAKRSDDRTQYDITAKGVSRLVIREAERAGSIRINGQSLSVKGQSELWLVSSAGRWQNSNATELPAVRKRHGLQGPIDDAFLEPFLVVRPTGTPWNAAANRQAVRLLDEFEKRYALAFRGRLRAKKDTEVTESDLEKYHVVLFGDPGSNGWIAKLDGKTPVAWTRARIALGSRSFSAADSLPAFVYPNPLSPSRYVVVNSGLTAEWEDWAGDFPTPQYGDFAVLKVSDSEGRSDVFYAGLFDEFWRLP